MRRKWWVLCLIVLCLDAVDAGLLLALDKGDQERRMPSERNWQIGFTPSVSSGNFGTNSTSTFVYVPLSIRRLFRDGDVAVVIPFVSATSDGRETLIGGSATRIDDGGGSNSGPGGGGSGSPDDGGCSGKGQSGSGKNRTCGTTTRLPGQKVTTAGIGDIILRGRYYVVEEKDFVPLIAVTGRVKIPTASANQGLGTGELDYGFGAEVSKMLGDWWIGFLDGGYNIIGDPEGLNFQNQYWYDIGAGYYFTKKLLVSLYFEEYRAVVPGFVNARDLFFSTYYRASDTWRFNAGLTVGVSNGAPDYGISIGTSYRF